MTGVRFSVADKTTGEWRDVTLAVDIAEMCRDGRPIAYMRRHFGEFFNARAMVWEMTEKP